MEPKSRSPITENYSHEAMREEYLPFFDSIGGAKTGESIDRFGFEGGNSITGGSGQGFIGLLYMPAIP